MDRFINKCSWALLMFLTVTSCIACSDRPSNVLDEDDMVSLMADMEIAEAYINIQPSSSKDKINYGKQVLESHRISEETLDTTLAWYGRNIDTYSELFEKVDKEILKRKKKYTEIKGDNQNETRDLWPYNSHAVISPLSGYESLNFSFQQPDIESGDILKLSFSLSKPISLKGTFGVEYEGGEGEAVVNNFNNKGKIELELQTDTAKKISRLFGIMDLKDTKVLPIFLDSISLRKEPLDTLKYRAKKRSQKHYGVMQAPKQKEVSVNQDTTILQSSNIVKEEINPDNLSGSDAKLTETNFSHKKNSERRREEGNRKSLRN